MVGHTHEDIDQSFSVLSRFLQKKSAVSMEGMPTQLHRVAHEACNINQKPASYYFLLIR